MKYFIRSLVLIITFCIRTMENCKKSNIRGALESFGQSQVVTAHDLWAMPCREKSPSQYKHCALPHITYSHIRHGVNHGVSVIYLICDNWYTLSLKASHSKAEEVTCIVLPLEHVWERLDFNTQLSLSHVNVFLSYIFVFWNHKNYHRIITKLLRFKITVTNCMLFWIYTYFLWPKAEQPCQEQPFVTSTSL